VYFYNPLEAAAAVARKSSDMKVNIPALAGEFQGHIGSFEYRGGGGTTELARFKIYTPRHNFVVFSVFAAHLR
jgi:hypothetical protein